MLPVSNEPDLAFQPGDFIKNRSPSERHRSNQNVGFGRKQFVNPYYLLLGENFKNKANFCPGRKLFYAALDSCNNFFIKPFGPSPREFSAAATDTQDLSCKRKACRPAPPVIVEKHRDEFGFLISQMFGCRAPKIR